MKFEILDKKMRVFESSMDQVVMPELFIVARLDGRGFTRLTKETLSLERPFDLKFRDAMIETVKYLMDCGFKVTYGYTESDEISLLFDKDENGFGRKTRKLISILAGEASARFSLMMSTAGVFDCRIVPLPSETLVIDYFRWRAEDANRNALNAYCYWKLRERGVSAPLATEKVKGLNTAEKNELLFQFGLNYNSVPSWQKRGVGLYYEKIGKDSYNPLTKRNAFVNRNVLKCDLDLPMNSDYTLFLNNQLFNDENEV